MGFGLYEMNRMCTAYGGSAKKALPLPLCVCVCVCVRVYHKTIFQAPIRMIDWDDKLQRWDLQPSNYLRHWLGGLVSWSQYFTPSNCHQLKHTQTPEVPPLSCQPHHID